MANVGIESRSANIIVDSVVELVVGNHCHHPDDCVEPHPGTCRVEALKSVVAVERIEEKVTHVRVVHWAGQRVDQDESNDCYWGHNSIGKFTSLFEHLLEVAHVNDSLREEYRIIVNHEEDMVQVLVLSLVLEVVQSDRAAGSNKFDPHSVMIAVWSVDGELEGVEAEHYGS